MQERLRSNTRPTFDLPDVSVVIPVNNARKLIDYQLHALAVQDYTGSFEVIVSDNGSTDGLREHIATHELRDRLDLVYVSANDHVGASHARNVGAERASSDLLAFCDADDVVDPSWLGSIVAALETHDVVGTALEEHTLNAKATVAVSPLGSPQEQGRTPFLPFAIGASLGCRAAAYRKLGGMVVTLRSGEDVEFSWHAQLEGFQFHFIEHPLVSYRLRSDLRSIWIQALALGIGTAQLRSLYLHHGAPRVSVWPSIRSLAILVSVANPVLPRRVTQLTRAQWTQRMAANFGLLIGGARHRSLGW